MKQEWHRPAGQRLELVSLCSLLTAVTLKLGSKAHKTQIHSMKKEKKQREEPANLLHFFMKISFRYMRRYDQTEKHE